MKVTQAPRRLLDLEAHLALRVLGLATAAGAVLMALAAAAIHL